MTARSLFVFPLACLGALVAAPVWPQPAPQVTHIPVILNIYWDRVNDGDKSIDPEDAKKAVEEANKILKQADLRLVVVQVNDPPAGNGGDDGLDLGFRGSSDDAEFTPRERVKVKEFGGKELAKLAGKKGLKISFAKKPQAENAASPGISTHRDPTIMVKDRGNAADTGSTIAHEIGHVMTLGAKHVIDGNAGRRADDAGHAPEGEGNTRNGNLMAPSQKRTGTHLTPDQIEEMKKRRFAHGHCTAQWNELYPAHKCAQGFGRGVDVVALNAAAPGHLTLREAWVSAVGDATGSLGDLDVQLALIEAPAPGEPLDAVYTLGFDTDANPATGETWGGLPGVDQRVTLRAFGPVDLLTPKWVLGELRAVSDSALPGLETARLSFPVSAEVVIDEELTQTDALGPNQALSVLLRLPAPSLGLAAAVVPVVVTAGTEAGPTSVVTFPFDTQAHTRRPTLMTAGTGTPTPGEPYPFVVQGLQPNAPFQLWLDETVVFSGVLDTTGGFAGAFLFPTHLGVEEYHFLTAQDASGEFAGSITCPRWSAPDPDPVPDPSPDPETDLEPLPGPPPGGA